MLLLLVGVLTVTFAPVQGPKLDTFEYRAEVEIKLYTGAFKEKSKKLRMRQLIKLPLLILLDAWSVTQ